MLSCSVGFSAVYCGLSWEDQTEKGLKPVWVKAWCAGEGEGRQHEGVHLVVVLQGVLVNVDGLQAGDQGVHQGGCLEDVAGVVLNFEVGAHVGAARGWMGCAEGRAFGAQSSTGIPLGILHRSPFPEKARSLP